MAKAYNIAKDALDGSIYDVNNKDSLINVVPDRIKPVLIRVKPKVPSVLFCTEAELRDKHRPDERDERVRLAFWDEYNHATQVGKKMSLSAFLQGVMSWEAWVTVYEPSDRKILWVLCPPVSYQTAMRNILHKGTERLMEIMKLPIVGPDGKPDSRVIVNILKAFQLVDMRVKGAVTQKLQIQQQSINVNHNMEMGSPHIVDGRPIESMGLEDLEAMERRIDKARKDSRRLLSQLPESEKEQYLAELADPASYKRGDQSMRLLEVPNLDADITLPADTLEVDVE